MEAERLAHLRGFALPADFEGKSKHRAPATAIGLGEALDEIEKLWELVSELSDDDPCRYDHDGYCQTHSLHEKPCPHEVARGMGLV